MTDSLKDTVVNALGKLRDNFSTREKVTPPWLVKAPAPTPEPQDNTGRNMMLSGLGLTGAGAKAHYDIGNMSKKLDKWERVMDLHANNMDRRDLGAMNTKDLLNRAQQVSDSYTRAGADVARSRVLGLPVGLLPTVKARADHAKQLDEAVRGGVGKEGINSLKNELESKLTHYQMFANRKIPWENLRGHMIEKSLGYTKDPQWLSGAPDIRGALTSGSGTMNDRLRDLAIKNTDPRLMSKLEDTLRLAQLGSGAPGPEGLGEMARLAGKPGVASSTPGVYRSATKGALKGLGHGRTSLLSLGPVALLAGLNMYSNRDQGNKMASADSDRSQDMGPGTRGILATLLGAAAPVSVMSGIKDLTDKSLNRLGITYGAQSYPGAMIGGGHKEPAIALREILEKRMQSLPESKRFGIDSFARNQHGLLEQLDSKGNSMAMAGKPGVNVMVNTGFGDYVPNVGKMDRAFTAEGALQGHVNQGRIPTKTLINYLTDAVPEDWKSYGATAGDRNKGGRTIMYGWGDQFKDRMGEAKNMGLNGRNKYTLGGQLGRLGKLTGISQLRHALGMSSSHTGTEHMGSSIPFAISPDTMAITENLHGGGSRKSLTDFVANPENNVKYPGARAEIQKALDAQAAGKKLLTISGATRGDYVATRAREIADLIKNKGDTNTHVVAQMVDAMKNPHQMAMLGDTAGMSVLGRLPKEQFLALQNLADKHWAATGTSSAAEAQLGRANVMQPREWGYHLSYPDNHPMFTDDAVENVRRFGSRAKKHVAAVPMKPGVSTIATRARNMLAGLFPGISPTEGQFGIGGWNRGQLQGHARQGNMLADTAEEAYEHLQKGTMNKDMAPIYRKEVMKAQENFADKILGEARRNKIMTRTKGLGKVMAPLALLPAAYEVMKGNVKQPIMPKIDWSAMR